MRLVKIAVGSVNPTVGAVRGNAERVIGQAREMAADAVTLGAFPEQVLGGYPPEDLVQWRAYVAAQWDALERVARETAALPTVLVMGVVVRVGGEVFNAAAAVHGGLILGAVPKEKLPTYDVFYEARTFARGAEGLALEAEGVPFGDRMFAFDFGIVAVEVCEDAWSPDGPMRRRCFSGAEVVVNVSASPYRVGVAATRREMLATRSADNEAVVVYANAVGGQDGLVFDGGGYVFQNGRLVLDAPRFRAGWAACVVDLDRTVRRRVENSTWRSDRARFRTERLPTPRVTAAAATTDRSVLRYPAAVGESFFLPPADRVERSPRDDLLDELFEALALGTRDYFAKSSAFRGFGVALSGGRDSVLTLLIAWRAAQLLGRAPGEVITAFYMPTRYSGEATRAAAATMCQELGAPLRILSVDDALDREVEATRTMLDGEDPTPVTRQNVQARVRAMRMWNWANSSGALFLQTGDMSEKAVGYTTIGGDLEGALSVIANVPKTVVIALLERLLTRFGFQGIARTLDTAPGPELAEDQRAEDDLMPFAVLDACLHLFAEEKLAPAEVRVALPALFPEIPGERLDAYAERFVTLFTRSIFKWVQSPLALHVGSLDLDRERALQLPVVQRREWF